MTTELRTQAQGKATSAPMMTCESLEMRLEIGQRFDKKMPHEFHVQIEQYLNAYKKEFQKEKKHRNTESKDADPIYSELYKQLLAWAQMQWS